YRGTSYQVRRNAACRATGGLNRMNRRELVTLGMAAALARPSRATAQVLGRIPKIGMLWHAGSAEEEGSYFTSLIQGFADLGYVDGRTAIFEHRYADEHYDRFPA